jgi:putative selenate reductase
MKSGFSILPFHQLVKITLSQIDYKKSYFGIPKEVFYIPRTSDPFRMNRFGQMLETPIGTAAGPHTQLSQNIVASWLCGARYIELKTIQTLDNLDVTKPCINMQDEGYNCEWSQELRIHDSFDQYLNAWIMIHILKDKLGIGKVNEIGTIFNMSVGYDSKGIMQENVQWFLQQMKDCSHLKAQKINEIRNIYPAIDQIYIPDCISNNVTLSTMHGCPPDEIEKIGLYLIEEKKLHTIIKLNPTLLGKENLNSILQKSDFEIIVPDQAFEHDLQYPEALKIIQHLQKAADLTNVQFGIKLTNTLETTNHKNVLPADEKTVYMSGRALHPIAISLATMLQQDFEGKLNISFSAGVNTFNLEKIISCGLVPVTVCTDLLKPGGYGLLNQYLINLSEKMATIHAGTIDEFILKASGYEKIIDGCLQNLSKYAKEVLDEKDYQIMGLHKPDIKTERELNGFDCIQAPCIDSCPTHQDIPDYMYFTSKNDFVNAFETIFRTNPFPHTTGMICDHQCQTKCTRVNYDNPLLIREIKRVIAESFTDKFFPSLQPPNGFKVAIIGAGPSGLTCAYYLNQAGFKTNVFESQNGPGGMVSAVIPSFRLGDAALKNDLERIENSGVKISYNSKIDTDRFNELRHDYNYIYISTGAWSSRKFAIEGITSLGVLEPIEFLRSAKQGVHIKTGKKIAVIGGGNTAMDAARTAFRLSGNKGQVTILYRRSKALMPADPDEISAAENEGVFILDLTLPVRVNAVNGKVKSLTCVRIKLEKRQGIDRPFPLEIPGSEFEMEFDTVIPAIGQDGIFDFVDGGLLKTEINDYETQIQNIFIGGDAKRGGSTVINAIADGRKTADLIMKYAGIQIDQSHYIQREAKSFNILMRNRMVRQKAISTPETPANERKNFNLVTSSLPVNLAIAEASRCLYCDELCNICVTVCPNLACYSYKAEPFEVHLQKIHKNNDLPIISNDKLFGVKQKYQILHIADWCNKCGNCSTFCPTSGEPYRDKPHLFINKITFENCVQGYYYDPLKNQLFFKDHLTIFSLNKSSNKYHFKKGDSLVILETNTFKIISFDLQDEQTIHLVKAAEMSVVLSGAIEFWTGLNK